MRSSSVVVALSALLFSAPLRAEDVPSQAPIASSDPSLPSGFTAPGAPAPTPVAYVAPTVAAPAQNDVANPLPVALAPAPGSDRDAPNAAPRAGSGFALDVGFGTEMPISVGGLVTAEVPGRVLFQLGLGVMPKGYVSAIDGFLTSVGAYDQSISQLVRGSLGNSFVLKASAGWRPFSDHGFEMLGGYTLMTLGGSVTAGDAINAVLGDAGASIRVPPGMNAEIPLAATLHNVHVTLGWRWLLADDHLVIRANVSYIQTVASNVGVSLANMGPAAPYESQVNTALNETTSPFFKTYAKAPTLGLSAAYRF